MPGKASEMAEISCDDRIPDNIVRLSIKDPQAVQSAYECGKLVILEDARIEADYAFLSSVRSPKAAHPGREKFCLARQDMKNGHQKREAIWRQFETGPFQNDPEGYARFQREVNSVNGQMNALVEHLFASLPFQTRSITWKFQRITGENLHIDNLQGCQKLAQIRLFANLHSTPRIWGIAQHWRAYASRLFETASLGEVLHDSYEFNTRLSVAAFGYSHHTTDDPRHVVTFSPGEVWLANSAIVAHQVRSGDLLTIAHYEYPYKGYSRKTESLPALIRQLGVEKLGYLGYHRKVLGLKLNPRPRGTR